MSKVTFVEQEVTIPVDNGIKRVQRKVQALCAGPFAIHTPYGLGRRGHTITHLPTGCRIFESPSLAKAKKAVSIMLASSTQWDTLTVRRARTKASKAQREEWLIPVVKQGLMILYSGETPEAYLARISKL